MKQIVHLFLLFAVSFANAQELNCQVSVSTQQLSNPNQQVFKNLETSVSEFINKTIWTDKSYAPHQKISCSMFINITAYDSDNFTTSIQVQSLRPVFDSTYLSPVLNYNDKDFVFTYIPYQNLVFNSAVFESNLISVIAFYCNLIIALDNESFEINSGSKYFGVCQEITNVAQPSGYAGWMQTDGNNSRFLLIRSLTNVQLQATKEAMFNYYEGLDLMTVNLKMAKDKIKYALISMDKANSEVSSPILMRMFFDAKANEIASIFSGGPSVDITALTESLQRMSPTNSQIWSKIKY